MQSVEFKAELRDAPLARGALPRIGAKLVGKLEQTDTYFRVTSGVLKLRRCSHAGEPEPPEVIHVERATERQPRVCRFRIYTEAEARERFGQLPLPVRTIVHKQREIWMLGGLRVHLDSVQHAGRFIELEALVSRRQHVGRCHEMIAAARRRLQPALGEPLTAGYAELVGDSDERGVEAPAA
ncbi:MAG: CYTH domain-containing protein [Planctomycetota bacterium]